MCFIVVTLFYIFSLYWENSWVLLSSLWFLQIQNWWWTYLSPAIKSISPNNIDQLLQWHGGVSSLLWHHIQVGHIKLISWILTRQLHPRLQKAVLLTLSHPSLGRGYLWTKWLLAWVRQRGQEEEDWTWWQPASTWSTGCWRWSAPSPSSSLETTRSWQFSTSGSTLFARPWLVDLIV